MPHLAGLAFPLNGLTLPRSGAHHPWFARRDTSKVLVEQ